MAIKISFDGNLVRDPELRDIAGQKACTFTVASRTRKKQQDGTYLTNYFDCTYFGKIAESFYARVQKGTNVTVWGEFVGDEYESKNGKKTALRVTVDSVSANARLKEASGTRSRSQASSADDTLPF